MTCVVHYRKYTHLYLRKSTMDTEHTPRRKKGDKAKEKFERNGVFSQRHVREAERLREEREKGGKNSSKKK